MQQPESIHNFAIQQKLLDVVHRVCTVIENDQDQCDEFKDLAVNFDRLAERANVCEQRANKTEDEVVRKEEHFRCFVEFMTDFQPLWRNSNAYKRAVEEQQKPQSNNESNDSAWWSSFVGNIFNIINFLNMIWGGQI